MKKIKFYFLFSLCLLFANLANAQNTSQFNYANNKGEKIYLLIINNSDDAGSWWYESKNTAMTQMGFSQTINQMNNGTCVFTLAGKEYWFQLVYGKYGKLFPVTLKEMNINGATVSTFYLAQ